MTQQDDITQRLRDNADLDEAEHGNARVVQLERDAADEIERLRREVSKLRAPVARDAKRDYSRSHLRAVVSPDSMLVKAHREAERMASAPVAGEAVTWEAVRQELAIFLMGATGRSSKEWHRPLDNASEGGALAKMRACLAAPQASEDGEHGE